MASYKKAARGGLGEGLVIMLIMFLLAMCFYLYAYVGDVLKPTMDEALTNTAVNASYQSVYSRTPSTMDNMFMIVFVLLWAGAIILAFFVDAHPVWFALSVIALSAVLIVCGVLSNVYGEFSADLDTQMTSSMPMMSYVMNHFVHFIIAIISSVMIALFAKSQT